MPNPIITIAYNCIDVRKIHHFRAFNGSTINGWNIEVFFVDREAPIRINFKQEKEQEECFHILELRWSQFIESRGD